MEKELTRADTAVPDQFAGPEETNKFHTEQVFTIAGAHFIHDTYSAFLSPLLPVLQERLSTNYALTGGLAIVAQIPSLLNPFIGYLADKVSLRYFIILAPGVTATLMSSMGLTPTYFSLALLLFAVGVSIAMFHAPAPAMVGRISGEQVGKGMSIFMASGELGRTLGPVVAVAGVGWFGLEGLWRLAFIGWAVSAILYFRLRHVPARPAALRKKVSWQIVAPKIRRLGIPLVWLILGRMMILVTLTTYLPIFMRDELHSTLWLAASSLTILEGAGVVGALAAGTLSDRWGRRRVLFILIGFSPFLLVGFLYGPGWMTLPLLLALGLTVISPQPVMLALVQDEFADNRALANGTYLMVTFLIRALGIWIIGVLADRFGLTTAYLWAAGIALFSVPAVWLLPKRKAPV